jgi:hypothetical protein
MPIEPRSPDHRSASIGPPAQPLVGPASLVTISPRMQRGDTIAKNVGRDRVRNGWQEPLGESGSIQADVSTRSSGSLGVIFFGRLVAFPQSHSKTQSSHKASPIVYGSMWERVMTSPQPTQLGGRITEKRELLRRRMAPASTHSFERITNYSGAKSFRAPASFDAVPLPKKMLP